MLSRGWADISKGICARCRKWKGSSLSNLRKVGFSGQRIATLSRFAVIKLGTISFLGRIIVKGPGQKFSANCRAKGLKVPNFSAFLCNQYE